MNAKTELTPIRVVFRKDKYATVAVFADGEPRERGYRSCYAHLGQHSSCTAGWYRSNTRAATPAEYADLLKELESIGYAVTIVSRVSWVA